MNGPPNGHGTGPTLNGMPLLFAVVQGPSGPLMFTVLQPRQAVRLVGGCLEDLRDQATTEILKGDSQIQVVPAGSVPPLKSV